MFMRKVVNAVAPAHFAYRRLLCLSSSEQKRLLKTTCTIKVKDSIRHHSPSLQHMIPKTKAQKRERKRNSASERKYSLDTVLIDVH